MRTVHEPGYVKVFRGSRRAKRQAKMQIYSVTVPKDLEEDERQMRADYHLHCEFSDDSEERMEAQIEQGIKIGLDEMCFTDHVDYGIKRDWDDPRGVVWADVTENGETLHKAIANVDYPKYFSKLEQMREHYGDRIRIKSGLEFGIQSHTIPQFAALYESCADRLDFVLFSMHQVGDQEFWTGDFQRNRTQKEYNEAYYEEILKTMQGFRDYSVLAHLDLIVRYDDRGIYPFEKVRDIIAEILKLAIREDKGIELNTSSWKYGLSDTQPSRDILRLYKDLGGRIITVGSDAHKKEYLGDHFSDAYEILKNELGFDSVCTYDKMSPRFHKL